MLEFHINVGNKIESASPPTAYVHLCLSPAPGKADQMTALSPRILQKDPPLSIADEWTPDSTVERRMF